jgi:hypothetical protein
VAGIPKVEVGGNGRALIQCPYCRSSRIVDVTRLRSFRESVRVRCVCRQSFSASLEWRRAFREETRLDGLYWRSGRDKDWGKIVVRNLSSAGIGFTTFTTHNLVRGDPLGITFSPDPPSDRDVKKKGIVKVVRERYVGCEWVESSKPFHLSQRTM